MANFTSPITIALTSPLFTDWTEQYAKLTVPGLPAGAGASLNIDGNKADFQYTGEVSCAGAEVLLRLGFNAGQTRQLVFQPAEACSTDLRRQAIPCENGATIGIPGRELEVPPLECCSGRVGILRGFAGFPLLSDIASGCELESRTLTRTNAGPLFVEYELRFDFASGRYYTATFRCFEHEPVVEVAERFSLDQGAEVQTVFNPEGAFDSILSHRGPEFEGEAQPVVEPVAKERPRDVLCRLQMPVLSEYFVPNNRGWFAFFNSSNEDRGMVGVLGLYGGRWRRPVDNMWKVKVEGGAARACASAHDGERYWLLYTGPVEKTYTPERRFVFHRLHAEWNALRLDEHLDLGGNDVYDASCWDRPGFFGPDYREKARRNTEALAPLQRALDEGIGKETKEPPVQLQALLDPAPELLQKLRDDLAHRFEKWIRDFKGYREGRHDYDKNTIGFSRRLRGLMISYELLRKEGALSDEDIRRFNAYFVFAARRITDEGRWPHSRTWKHPDHPESTRDFYAYNGEHRPDRLVWTNCLPNFQSDPLCALLHLGCLIPDHPDAAGWRRFAMDDIDRQLDAYCGHSGAWAESINYALYTLSYFVITFRVLKNRFGIDYFNDERMRRFAGWLVRFFGPLDKRFGACTFPAIGNSVTPQNQADYLLAYAGELDEDDPLRAALISVYQKCEPHIRLTEHYPAVLAAMAPIPTGEYPLQPLSSEHMDELGVAMRHNHPGPRESYLFQKIGFYKDHYEGDETAFNWYAKGTPLTMEYGTYTRDAGVAGAHNLVEIAEMDNLRRGYLADHLLTPMVDYTRCEVPVVLKLQHGRIRDFDEIDGPPREPLFFYIGDENPVGPKVWKVRMLLFVKPDYVVLFDRVFGAVPHRFNLHAVADDIRRDGPVVRATGRFDLDLLCFVQHPEQFELQTGELAPEPRRFGEGRANPHHQSFFRIPNSRDGVYRTLLFAQERGREVTIEPAGRCGMLVRTPEYTDYVFINDDDVFETFEGGAFIGRAGWIRKTAAGAVAACVPDGDLLEAFGCRMEGRGPWHYNTAGDGQVTVKGTPRPVRVLWR